MLTTSHLLDSCNFAIMSYTAGYGSMSALGGTSWAKINAAGNFMTTKCLLNGPSASGGVVVIPSSEILPSKFLCKAID